MAEHRIEHGTRVQMHCSLALADGTEALSTFEDDPIDLTIGDGTLIPALEENLIGMTAGQKHTFLLTPEHAYGAHDDSLVMDMPLGDFAESPEPGQILGFTLPDGRETPGAILSVEEKTVRVDFNHPLAGRDLVFRVAILAVTLPTRSLS